MYKRGKHFKIDENSDFNSGKIRYRYLPCKEKTSSYCPIFVIIDKFSIDFFFHGESPNKTHVNTNILHLPLSINLAIKDNLTYVLREAFFSDYSLNDKYKITENGKEPEYKNLPCFSRNKKRKNGKKIIIKNLALDFIFDLEHSEIFATSPFTEEAEIHLKENFYFSAIAAKAAYYYNREVYLNSQHVGNEKTHWCYPKRLIEAIGQRLKIVHNKRSKTGSKGVQKFYAERLAEAEIQWLNIIRDKRATESFLFRNWFKKDVEEEYDYVLLKKKLPNDDKKFNRKDWRKELKAQETSNKKESDNSFWNWIKKLKSEGFSVIRVSDNSKDKNEYDNQNIRILKESARWFLRRYAIGKAIRSIYSYFACWRLGVIFILLIINVLLFYFGIIKVSQTLSFWGVILVNTLVLMWVFWGMLILIISSSLPRLLMAITSTWLFFITTEELVKNSFDVTFNGWVLFLFIPIIAFMAVEINNTAPGISPIKSAFRIGGILSISIFYSIVIGAIFMSFMTEKILVRSGYLNQFVIGNIENKSEFNIPPELAAIGIGLLEDENDVFSGISGDPQYLANKFDSFKIDIDSLLPSEKIKIEFFLRKYFYPNTAIYDSLKNDKARVKKFISEIKNPTVNAEYNLLCNVTYKNPPFWSNILNNSLLYKSKMLGLEISVFPGMLFYRAVFVLFIGIFIQLIFEDKPITEPL